MKPAQRSRVIRDLISRFESAAIAKTVMYSQPSSKWEYITKAYGKAKFALREALKSGVR